MEAPANVVRFFGSFNFMTPAQAGQLMRYILYLKALRVCSFRGTGRA